MDGIVTGLWIVTALGGVGLYVLWSRAARVGIEARARAAPDGQAGAVTSDRVAPHASFALGGLALWYAASIAGDRETAGRIVAVIALLVAMAIGTSMFLRWRKTTRGPDTALPLAFVLGHGLLAVATLLTAVVALVVS